MLNIWGLKVGCPENAKWSYEAGGWPYRTIEASKAENVEWICAFVDPIEYMSIWRLEV